MDSIRESNSLNLRSGLIFCQSQSGFSLFANKDHQTTLALRKELTDNVISGLT